MGRKKNVLSPAQKSAKEIKKKYKRGHHLSPGKRQNVRRALYDIKEKKVSIRKAAREYNLSYGFVHRRLSGEVDIDKGKGPPPIFSAAEEEALASWLSEMAERGMGLRPCEFLDVIQNIVIKDKRKTPFKNGRPGYGWFVAFKTRNAHIITTKPETPLELCRAKVTKEVTDKWYSNFRTFLLSKNLLDKPSQIWNADESGFSMGSNKAKVLGPARSDKTHVPHITAGKQRLTVMFCGSASGQIMPPFFVYPQPRPKGYNPLTGAIEGSGIAYTKKGWMDAVTFSLFIDHFDKYAGTERPVLLLIDSVSSHVESSVFEKSKLNGIELYRIVPNATHLMQPLDVGVFGPLKAKWHLVARKHARENPGKSIGKETFPEKLKEAFLLFYRPLTVINAFKSSGIYPVDNSVISRDTLKPGLTFSGKESVETGSSTHEEPQPVQSIRRDIHTETNKASDALQAFDDVLSTPVRVKYHTRIEEGYDVEGESPCFDIYKKLHEKAKSADWSQAELVTSTESSGISDNRAVDQDKETNGAIVNVSDDNCTDKDSDETSGITLKVSADKRTDQDKESSSTTFNVSGLDVLAEAASLFDKEPVCNISNAETSSSCEYSLEISSVSPVVSEALIFPKVPDTNKPKPTRLLDKLPDNLTSPECIRSMSLKQLDKIRLFAERERKAKLSFLKKIKSKSVKRQSKTSKKGTAPQKKQRKEERSQKSNEKEEAEAFCKGCLMTWKEDINIGNGSVWVQCDNCDGWLHTECVLDPVFEDEHFQCPDCQTNKTT